MAEWSIAAVLKTVELQGSGGSNPSLSVLASAFGAFLCRRKKAAIVTYVHVRSYRGFFCSSNCIQNRCAKIHTLRFLVG